MKKKDKISMVRQNYPLIHYRDTGDHRILESDWTRDTPGLTQPKV